MKKMLIVFALLIPMLANAMKITTDEIDEFTGERTVITSWETIYKHKIRIRLRQQNGKKYLDFKFIPDQAIVISKDDKLMIKSTSDAIGTFSSIATYLGGRGDGAVGLEGSGLWGISATYSGDLSWFSDNCTRLIRVYASDGYYDCKISDSEGKKLMKLYELFDQTINDSVGASAFANYSIKYLKRKIGSSTWNTEKEEYIKDVSSSELDAIVEKWKSQANDKYEYDVQLKKKK